jgi:hypothetical protein
VEHRVGVKELGIEAEAAALTGECASVIDSAGMVKQQWRVSISDEFCYLSG